MVASLCFLINFDLINNMTFPLNGFCFTFPLHHPLPSQTLLLISLFHDTRSYSLIEPEAVFLKRQVVAGIFDLLFVLD